MTLLEAGKALELDWSESIARFSGNEGLFLRFLLRFPQEKTILSLSQAWEAQDFAGLETAAHTLKGVCANLGLKPAQEACDALVQALRRGEREQLPLLYQQAQACLTRTCEILSQVQ